MEGVFYDELYRRCPLNKLHFDSSIHYTQLQQHLNAILEHNAYYVKQVLKKLVDDECVADDYDWMYEMYVALLQVACPPATQRDVIRYSFNHGIKVDIFEKPNLISAMSTTGFRTWEAALYMCDYLTLNAQDNFKDANVLELGAGTGLSSLTLIKMNIAKKLYVTDGDSELIGGQLQDNFKKNTADRYNTQFKLQKLLWGQDAIPEDIDIVIAADVTYDDTLFEELCKCLKQCLVDNTRCKYALISATIRNTSTDQKFHDQCHKNGLSLQIITSTETNPESLTRINNQLQRPAVAPIRIYKIFK